MGSTDLRHEMFAWRYTPTISLHCHLDDLSTGVQDRELYMLGTMLSMGKVH